MSREDIARWLIEKLLGSFVISVVLIYGPIFGFNIFERGLGTTYATVTSVTLIISVLANILLPKDFGISRRIASLRKNEDKDKEHIP